MDKKLLRSTAQKMMAQGKGILASDERNSSLDKKFEKYGIENNEDNRKRYRELFINTPNIQNYINGIILFEETFKQTDSNEKLFRQTLSEKGILVGVKADGGYEDFGNRGEQVSMGLDGLDEKLSSYKKLGASFTKWRAKILIDNNLPTFECVLENAKRLAEYASVSQKNSLVPIVEPEVLIDGGHTIEKSKQVTIESYKTVFDELSKKDVYLPGLVLKASMIHQGKDSDQPIDHKQIAQLTASALESSVPKNVGGVVFLSGGQAPMEASKNLNEIAELEPLSWEITFSYLRAIEGPAFDIWQGRDENVQKARLVFEQILKRNTLADKAML